MPSAATYSARKALGLCIRCGREDARPQRSKCAACKDQQSEEERVRLTSDVGAWAKRVARLQQKRGRKGITTDLVLRVWRKSKGVCRYTGAPIKFGVNASLDHVIPVSRGGSDAESNLCFVHRNVNLAKSNLTESEFLAMCRLVAANHPRRPNDDHEHEARPRDDDLHASRAAPTRSARRAR